MTFEIFNFSVKPESTKDMIIMILSEEFPLTLPKIKNILQKKYHKTISYQGVYKEINLMIEKKIIIKDEKSYLLNKEWILNLNKYSEHLYLTYSKIKKYSLSVFSKLEKEGDVITLNFSSITELDEYFIEAMDHFNKNINNKDTIVMYYYHNWWPVLYSKKEKNILEFDPKNKKFYCICGSNTALDKWSTDYENEIGMNVKIVTNYNKNFEFQIYQDIVIQVYIDPKITKKIDNYFNKCSDFSNFNINDFIHILNEKQNITLVLLKNEMLAKALRSEVMGVFNKK